MSMMGMTSKGITQSSWTPYFSRSLGFFFKSCRPGLVTIDLQARQGENYNLSLSSAFNSLPLQTQ